LAAVKVEVKALATESTIHFICHVSLLVRGAEPIQTELVGKLHAPYHDLLTKGDRLPLHLVSKEWIELEPTA
jgi:hypothetical protein